MNTVPINAKPEPLSNQAESSSRTSLKYLRFRSTQLHFLKTTSAKACRGIKFSIPFCLKRPSPLSQQLAREHSQRSQQVKALQTRVPYLSPPHSGNGGFANGKEPALKTGGVWTPQIPSSPLFPLPSNSNACSSL